MRFKDWYINETGTYTNDIAQFKQPCLPMIRRQTWPNVTDDDLKNKDQKKKKKSS